MNSLKHLIVAFACVSASSMFALNATIIVRQEFSPCFQPRGELQAYGSGGAPPYTYQWSTGATTPSITDLPAGTYTVTVTDNVGAQAMDSADITGIFQYPTYYPVGRLSYCTEGQPYSFFPLQDNVLLLPTEPTTFGIPVVSQALTDDGWNWILELNDGPGEYHINYTDALGCSGVWIYNVNPPVNLPAISVSGIGGSCSDGSIGAATISIPAVPDNNDLYLTVKGPAGNVVYETGCDIEVGGWTALNLQLTDLAVGDHWAVLDVDEACFFNVLPSFLAPCADSVMFTIPDLGIQCGDVIGTLFVDADGDCVLDADENRVPNTVISVAPGPLFTSTNAIGYYGTDAPQGPNTFNAQHPILAQSCSGAVNVIAGTSQTLEIGMAPDAPLDVMVSMGSSAMRPGFNGNYQVQVRNLTDGNTGTVSLVLDLDPALQFNSASPTPTTVSGNTITWTDPNFTMSNVFEQDNFQISVTVPADILLVGTVLNSIATLTTANMDADLMNNTITVGTTVTASLDPNDKIAQTSTRQETDLYLIDEDEWIDYTIRFQNTGTDTAFNVVVTDTLPTTLDPLSLLVGAASHPMTWTISGAGILRFAFPDILLPDSTTNEAESHGLLTLRIKPLLPVLPGTLIVNIANIYFDFNPPVITEPSVLVAEFSTGVREIADPEVILLPNPARDVFEIRGLGQDPLRVTLLSIDGRTVRSFSNANGERRFMLGGISSGAYLVELTLRNGTATRLPLIIEHH